MEVEHAIKNQIAPLSLHQPLHHTTAPMPFLQLDSQFPFLELGFTFMFFHHDFFCFPFKFHAFTFTLCQNSYSCLYACKFHILQISGMRFLNSTPHHTSLYGFQFLQVPSHIQFIF